MFPERSFWSKFDNKQEIIKIIKRNFYGFCQIAATIGLVYEDKTRRFRDLSNGTLLTVEEIADLFVRFNKRVKEIEKMYFKGPHIVTSLN